MSGTNTANISTFPLYVYGTCPIPVSRKPLGWQRPARCCTSLRRALPWTPDCCLRRIALWIWLTNDCDISRILKIYRRERNQDGRVEGRALTPSCENTRITTSYWTIIDRKTLELTKKDTPHPKTKEKPQWDGRRGAIRVKSNPITGGWVTHRLVNTYTTEVHPLEWRLWAPRQASQPGGPGMGGGIHRESDFEA